MEQELCFESTSKDDFRIDFFDKFFKFMNGFLAQLSLHSDQGCVLAYVVSPLGKKNSIKSIAFIDLEI